jgi:aspartyl-tRNA synthetase
MMYRTNTCGELNKQSVGTTVTLAGWLHNRRDHGGLMFIDLRDNYGLTQLVLHPETPGFETMDRLSKESVVQVKGEVVDRLPGTVNASLATGEIEIKVSSVRVLSEAAPLPVPVVQEKDQKLYAEELRLKHRYLDLRRDALHKNILLRSDVIAYLRDAMRAQGFREFQTPILTASSPEGARDFLVPSRLHPGQFYALPQAPQQFKQLLMVAGFDKYFQIAPCFRDESARADRSPGEFYQLDVEMSFVDQQDVFDAIEPVMHGVFEKFAPLTEAKEPWSVSSYPFKQIPYRTAISTYGTDKPDLRNPLVFKGVSHFFVDSPFTFFADMLKLTPDNLTEELSEVWGIAVPEVTSGFCKKMDQWAKDEGRGLAYIRYADEGGWATTGNKADGPPTHPHKAFGPVANKIGQEAASAIAMDFNLLDYGEPAVFFIAGKPSDFYKFAGLVRTKLSEMYVEQASVIGLTEKDAGWWAMPKQNSFEICWIVDFPMYELNDQGKIDFSHNPFSMPQGQMDALESRPPLDILAHQYDIVCNGIELCSGGIRNHKPEIMLKAFEIAGYSAAEVEDKFGGMLNAFRYGAPPHGGLAPGIDRIVMLLAEAETIREVIAFPLNQQGQDLMMNAPGPVTDLQLKELRIKPARRHPFHGLQPCSH